MVLKNQKKRVVISGSPGAGKTSIIMALKNKGYTIFEEYSRNLIKSAQSDGIENMFLEDPILFSKKVLRVRQKQFTAIKNYSNPKNNIIYYDRGVHDTYAYLKAIGKQNLYFENIIKNYNYDFIFLVPPWEKIYVKDSGRFETFKQAKMYYPFIKEAYSINHKVIEVPLTSISNRILFIETYIQSHV